MVKLGKSGACHHPPHRGQARIGPQAGHAPGEPEPQPAATLLDGAGQGAIVDQRPADALQPTGPLQGAAPDQHATAGRAGNAAGRVGDRSEGVELLEEEDEGRDQQPGPNPTRIEQRHQ